MWDQDDLPSHHPPYDGFLVSRLLQTDAQGHYQMTLVGYKRQGTSICANPPYSQDLTLLMSLQNNNNVSHLVSVMERLIFLWVKNQMQIHNNSKLV